MVVSNFGETCVARLAELSWADGRIYLDLASVPDAHNDFVFSDSVVEGNAEKPPEVYHGDNDVDKMTVVYTLREDINAQRFLTLPKAALDRRHTVTRRVTIDLDIDLVVADEIVRGLSRYALYRQLPFGINRFKSMCIADARVRKTSDVVAMIMCEADLEEGDHDLYAAAGMDEIGEILGFRTPGKPIEGQLPYDGLYSGPAP